MISKLHLKNFKCYGTPAVNAPLGRKITLIFGENSGGKSTLVHSLMGLRQTLDAPGGWTSFTPVGSHINLGAFGQLQHNHRDVDITIGVWLDGVGGAEFVYGGLNEIEDRNRKLRANILQHVEISDENDHSVGFVVARDELRHADGGVSLELAPQSRIDLLRRALAKYREQGGMPGDEPRRNLVVGEIERALSVLNAQAAGLFTVVAHMRLREVVVRYERLSSEIIRPLEPQVDVSKIADERERQMAIEQFEHDSRLNDDAWQAAIVAFRDAIRDSELISLIETQVRQRLGTGLTLAADAIRNVHHIGPFRVPGMRQTHVDSNARHDYVGKSGEDTLRVLYRDDGGLREMVAKLLSAMHTTVEIPAVYSVHINTVDAFSSAIAELILRSDSADHTLLDVGSGYANVLPVLVQFALELQALRGATVWVEQPELHLHPRLQVGLARALANAYIEAEATPIDGGNSALPRLVLETHSENLVLAFAKLIKGGELEPADVQILWVGRDDHGNHIIRAIGIGADGRFNAPWPGGFFTERLSLLRMGF